MKTPQLMAVAVARKDLEARLRSHDPHSYTLSTFYPYGPARDAFVASRAFDLEMVRIAHSSKKLQLAKSRFAFWRDSLQAVYSESHTVPAEPLAVLLAHTLNINNSHKHSGPGAHLSKRFFLQMLQSREQNVDRGWLPARSIETLQQYGESIYTPLSRLSQQAMYSCVPKFYNYLREHSEHQQQIELLAAHIGQATGIATLLKQYRYLVRLLIVPLPINLLTLHNLSQQRLIRVETEHSSLSQGEAKALSDVAFSIATQANDHALSVAAILEQVKEAWNSVPSAILIPAMSIIPVKLYLERLQRADFNLYSPHMLSPEWRMSFRCLKAYWTQMV